MPAIFILVMSLALRDAFVPGMPADLGYAIVDLDRSEASQALEQQLAGIDLLREFGALENESVAREAVASGRIAFVLVIPQGFAAQMASTSNATAAPTLRMLTDPTVPLAVRNGFRQQVEAEVTRLQLTGLLGRIGRSLMIPELRELASNAPPQQVLSEAVRSSDAGTDAETSQALPSSVQQNVPAWLIFSMFFVVVPISAVFIAERQHGTLQRLATQQVSFGLILAGKLLPFFVVNQVQAVVMVLVGQHLVPLAGGEALVLPASAAS
ncbi:MAG: ABC transporter permease, partial [Betaproteobacteria bacterium HGW-Betaproteobacteria-21]